MGDEPWNDRVLSSVSSHALSKRFSTHNQTITSIASVYIQEQGFVSLFLQKKNNEIDVSIMKKSSTTFSKDNRDLESNALGATKEEALESDKPILIFVWYHTRRGILNNLLHPFRHNVEYHTNCGYQCVVVFYIEREEELFLSNEVFLLRSTSESAKDCRDTSNREYT